MKRIKAGIIGCGAIGSSLAKFIEKLDEKKITLYGICDLDEKKVEKLISQLKKKPKVFNLEKIIKTCDLIIEAANIETAKELIEKDFKFKKDLFILSSGVFIKYPQVLEKIKKEKINLYIPSGAIVGIDGLLAVRYSRIKKIVLVTSKSVLSVSS